MRYSPSARTPPRWRRGLLVVSLSQYANGTFNVIPGAASQAAQRVLVCAIALLMSVVATTVRAATATSRQTGNWDTPSTWSFTRTGTITATPSSANVTGAGTLFTAELAVNDVIMNAAGNVVGTVKSITDNTNLVLQANAAVGVGNQAYTVQKVPLATDTVLIGANAIHAVTIPAGYAAAAASLTIGNTGQTGPSSLTLAAASSSLSISGAVTVNNPSNNNNTNALNANAGAVSVTGSLTLTGGAGNRDAQLTISTGTVSITGSLNVNNSNADVTFTGSGTLNIGGDFANGATFTGSTGTVAYNGSGAQKVGAYTYNNLTVNKSGGAAALTANSPVAGELTVTAGTLDLGAFAANRTVAGGTLSVANGATLKIGGTNSFPSNYTARTLGASSTVDYSGTNQIVTAETYGNLSLSGSGAKTPLAGTTTIAGDFTLATGVTYAGTTNNPVVNLAGNFSNSGTFDSGTGTFAFNGAGAQTLTGTTTFTNLRMNNSGAGLAINNNVTVSTLFTLTSGVVSTGSNTLITTADCPGSVSRTGGHVAGLLRLQIPTGSPTCAFDVGDSTTYRPINLTFASVTTAGNVTGSVSQSAGDHPNISTSGLDDTQSVNRYWTLTNGGVVLSSYGATFNFVAADVDGGADATQFEIERWDGAAWNTTTAGTRTSTSTQAAGITAFSDFASGKKKPAAATPGSFNTFESSTSAGSITGVIRTKIAGTAFSLDVVAIASGAQLNSFTNQVTVELLGNNTLGVALDANNCPTSFTAVQTVTPNPTITGGRSTVNFAAVPDSWRDVRVRVRWPTALPTLTSCSTDNFAIRPNTFANFSASDTDWQTAGTGRSLNDVTFGSVTHKAGRPFTVRADAVNAAGTPAITTNYSGTPTATVSACVGAACTATFGTLGLSPVFASGQLTLNTATYSEVGSFRLQLVDSGFASVDSADGSTAVEREIVSAVIDVGRFVLDHFAVSLNTPVFGTACGSGNFTYAGQVFGYATAPVITVLAQDFANNTTTLYTGNWWRITNASLTGKSYSVASGTLDASGVPGTDPVISDAGSGTGTLTFSSGSGMFFSRATPVAPFDAEIRLEINVLDSDGVGVVGNPVAFGVASAGNGISFNNGKQMRFGRLRLGNANGSQLLPLPLQMQAQYWNSAGTAFITNTADSCTTIAAANIALGNYQRNLNACETSVTASSFSGGRATVLMGAPGSGNSGSVDLTVNLGASGSGSSCIAGVPTAVTGANRAHLQGNWSGGAYDQNPSSRATFGIYKGSEEIIYIRENF